MLQVPQPPHPEHLPAAAPALQPGRYGIDSQHPACSPLLAQQLASFQAFQLGPPSTAKPGRQLSRVYVSRMVVSITTLLGYCHHHQLRLPGGQLSLEACAQPGLILLFIKAKMQAGQAQQTVVKLVEHMRKVAQWWSSQPVSPAARGALPHLEAWLRSMAIVVVHTLPARRRDKEELEAQGAWISAPDLVKAVEAARARVRADLAACLQVGCPCSLLHWALRALA